MTNPDLAEARLGSLDVTAGSISERPSKGTPRSAPDTGQHSEDSSSSLDGNPHVDEGQAWCKPDGDAVVKAIAEALITDPNWVEADACAPVETATRVAAALMRECQGCGEKVADADIYDYGGEDAHTVWPDAPFYSSESAGLPCGPISGRVTDPAEGGV